LGEEKPNGGLGGKVIYFVQGTITKNIKIGYTYSEPNMRLGSIQSSDRLILLKVIEGDELEENRIHRRFQAAWDHGEWFRPVPELLEYIASLPQTSFDGMIQNDAPPAWGLLELIEKRVASRERARKEKMEVEERREAERLAEIRKAEEARKLSIAKHLQKLKEEGERDERRKNKGEIAEAAYSSTLQTGPITADELIGNTKVGDSVLDGIAAADDERLAEAVRTIMSGYKIQESLVRLPGHTNFRIPKNYSAEEIALLERREKCYEEYVSNLNTSRIRTVLKWEYKNSKWREQEPNFIPKPFAITYSEEQFDMQHSMEGLTPKEYKDIRTTLCVI
jgi:hypothetical protein